MAGFLFKCPVKSCHRLIAHFIGYFLKGQLIQLVLQNQATGFSYSIAVQKTIEVGSVLIENYAQNAILSIVRNITEKKEIQRKMVESVVHTEENERRRIATDLHDGLGSLLSSLNLYVDMLDNPKLSIEEKENQITFEFDMNKKEKECWCQNKKCT